MPLKAFLPFFTISSWISYVTLLVLWHLCAVLQEDLLLCCYEFLYLPVVLQLALQE